jgi:hypothetical protein
MNTLKIYPSKIPHEPKPQLWLRDEDFELVAECGADVPENETKAAEIVKKFNAYPDLLTTLKGAYGALKIALKCNHFTSDEYAHIGEWTDEVRAAIEAAEG